MRKFTLLCAAAAIVAPAAAYAQETTSVIRGTVTNHGQPVVGATVTVINTTNGSRSSATTGADGSFLFPGLLPGGPYTVQVASPQGSKTVTDIFTVVQQAYEVPVELGVSETGSAAQGTATAPAAPAEAEIVVTATSIRGAGVRSNGPQTVLTQADVKKVASVNRDIRDIERRDPFATMDLSNAGDRGGAVSFAGVNPRFNHFTINGVTVGDQFGLNQDASPNIRGPVPYDAIGQVSVSIAPYDFRQSGFQGGAIDVVLLSGTNQFHGTGFYSENTDGLSGHRIGSLSIVTPKFNSRTYGATLRGPIIRDRLFFMISGERNTDPRPFDTQVSQVPNLNQSIIDNIVGIAKSKYNIDAGSVLTINPKKDEKIVGRLDWNITSGQRLSLSYINAYDALVSTNNTSTSSSTPQYGLSTNAYNLTELLRAGIAQLNSDWSDKFSTEIRGIYKWYKRGQEPLGGRPNGQLQVCNDPISVGSTTACSTGVPRITFGPDNFRQTNQLSTSTLEGSFLARYRTGGHDVKFLVDVSRNRTFNNFVPNSLGAWYFDSLADFQAGRANQLQYAAVIGSNPLGAAANFNYKEYTVGLQDDWKVMENLTVTYGARVDMFGMDQIPVFNPFFYSRYGYPNTKNYSGQLQFEPRLSFNWGATRRLRLRGGAGIFAGGSPDIYMSNSFSNTITTSTISITRSAAGADTCTGGVPNDICQAALNNVSGHVPANVAAFAANATNPITFPRTNTGALAPNFHLPDSLKATLSADYTLFGIDFGADYYYSKTLHGIVFTDARSVVVGTLPDGRPRYNGVTAFTDTGVDIIVGNTKKGRSHVGVLRASKTFDWGLSLFGSYTYQDVKDVSNATSSTITSNYRNQFFANPNYPAYGISSDQTKWEFKYSASFDHAFFGDYRTVVALFGETRAGRVYSYTMNDNTSVRSTVFGTNLTGVSAPTNLIYVPTGPNDPIVSYDSAATQAALDAFINSTALKKYRGMIAPKNIARNRAFTRIDLHLEQEIPTFVGRSRITLFADIANLPNLINHNWGGLSQLSFPYAASLVNVQCLVTPVATGATPAGSQVAASSTQACTQYRYSSFRSPNDSVVNVSQSLYAIRIGARFTF